ncbi:MAG: prolipoprotein diacylglyceryl transferase [Armatimonadia bacterium]|nr:prolipoprotein diacylglyceryl transferase [Armatimonadia bacterium]
MHSVLFEIPGFEIGGTAVGPFPIHAYGTMLALAFIAAFIGLWRLVARTKLMPPDHSIDVVLIMLLSGVVGARLLYVLLNLGDYFGESPTPAIEALYIWKGGLAFHGGVIGAMIGGLFCARRMRISYGALADHIAPVLALGYAITKMGCFLNGCCHGHPAEGLAWACQFPVYPGNLNELTPPSHPAQIYDMLLNLAAMGILLWLFLRRRRWNGQVFLWWLVLYSITRIVTDWFRYYAEVPAWSTAEAVPGMADLPIINAVTQAQLGSLAAVVAAATALIACRRCTFGDRVDLRAVPAFTLGTVPVMAFFFYWLWREGHGSVAGTIIYAVGVVLGAAGYPAIARRFPFSKQEALRGTPQGPGQYWDDDADYVPPPEEYDEPDAEADDKAEPSAEHEPESAEGDEDGTDRIP